MPLFPKNRRAPGVWGDGFADDDWSSMCSARSWDQLDTDEYARLYPHVLGQAEVARAALAARVADLIQRGGGMAAEDAAFLQRILAGFRGSRSSPSTAAHRSCFGFLTGVHPAYLWQASMVTHERDGAACWLGILARGRPALMPMDVADYFADVIVPSAAGLEIVDRQMMTFVRYGASPRVLRQAVMARRQGHCVVVRRSLFSRRIDRESVIAAEYDEGAALDGGLTEAGVGYAEVR